MQKFLCLLVVDIPYISRCLVFLFQRPLKFKNFHPTKRRLPGLVNLQNSIKPVKCSPPTLFLPSRQRRCIPPFPPINPLATKRCTCISRSAGLLHSDRYGRCRSTAALGKKGTPPTPRGGRRDEHTTPTTDRGGGAPCTLFRTVFEVSDNVWVDAWITDGLIEAKGP